MLEWLKTILGEHYTEDVDKKVSEEIGKAFVSKADFNAANEAKKTAEASIKERDKQLETLKAASGDAEALKTEIAKLQTANMEAQKKYESELKQIKLDNAVDAALAKSGAVNNKAVRALLDASKISLDGDNLLGLDDQLKALKATEKWAFQQTNAPLPSGANPPGAGGATKREELIQAYNEAEKRRDVVMMQNLQAQIKSTKT